MLLLPNYMYHAARSLEDACEVLAENPGEAKLLAGGTDLLVSMKQGLSAPRYLVGLRKIESLRALRYDEDGLTLGALVTLQQLKTSAEVVKHFPMLGEAASKAGSWHHQNMGTVGGNACLDTRCRYYNQDAFWQDSYGRCYKLGGDICYVVRGKQECVAAYSGDVAPALLALGATVTVMGPEGERTFPLTSLYSNEGVRPFTLAPGDIITSFHLPPPDPGACGFYEKYRRRGTIDFPLAGIAVLLVRPNGRSTCTQARIAVTGMGPMPFLAEEASALLEQELLTQETIDAAGRALWKAAHPTKTTIAEPSHRKRMVRILFERRLRALVGLSQPG